MVDALSLGVSVLAFIIAIIAIILAFVIPGPTGSQGQKGPPGITGGQNFSGFENVNNNSTIDFIPGFLYNVSGITGAILSGPTDNIKSGDTITINNSGNSDVHLYMSFSNGGYCQQDYEGLMDTITIIPDTTLLMISTGNTCDDGTGAELFLITN